MKTLLQLFFPTIKSIILVISFIFTIVSISYTGIVMIAKTEAKNIEDKILAVRKADIEHLDKRFDYIDDLFGRAFKLCFFSNISGKKILLPRRKTITQRALYDLRSRI